MASKRVTTTVKPFSISGNMDVGSCCACDLFDGDGKLIKHVVQYCLILCKNPGCGHYVCKAHLQLCGYCVGCCVEEHGLGSHE